ncbi:putative ubiquitin carboxyl-terminal hydrolase 50 [Poeciliopsis prolifica]|uniref:putative ubiquitin carboxyl-terminal hydrolase 50 n=1 Tax=Poeciliopsis prolifica TaxID=188132 RepID=UPI002413B24A|nr:putative ubiquitin carboxyl-terminal hydrolase 50 [Poeciliopsis prolifica]
MYLYSPEQLQTQSNTPVVAQVVKRLVEPFCGQGRIVQLDNSARMEGRLKTILSELQINIQLPPSEKKQTISLPSPSSLCETSKESNSELTAHLQGWTGPALLPLSDLSGSGADAFMPGFWAALHTVCINTFVLHTLQRRAPGRTVPLPGFTRALASQLAAGSSSVAIPVLPPLNSCSDQETTNLSKQRSNTNGCFRMMEGTSYNLRSRPSTPSNKQGKPGVVGLDNIGNSCYFNAVMQCLCSTMPFVEDLLCHATRRDLEKCDCKIAQVFIQLLDQMWQGTSTSCSPVQVMSALPSVFPQFDSYTQQDAQELLLHLLDALHEDLKKMHLSRKQPGKKQSRNSKTESTLVSDLFEGQLSYLTSFLHCGHEAHNNQTFTILSLPIPNDKKCTIQDCLSLFFEESVLTGAEQSDCSYCGRRREATVQTYLNKPPEILILHLKRFCCKGRRQVKLSANVSFSMELDITPFLSGSVRRRPSYHLYAVVIHRGNLDMGHYTALCYNSVLETWHWFDDSLVKEVNGNIVQSPDAYILFYTCNPF